MSSCGCSLVSCCLPGVSFRDSHSRTNLSLSQAVIPLHSQGLVSSSSQELDRNPYPGTYFFRDRVIDRLQSVQLLLITLPLFRHGYIVSITSFRSEPAAVSYWFSACFTTVMKCSALDPFSVRPFETKKTAFCRWLRRLAAFHPGY